MIIVIVVINFYGNLIRLKCDFIELFCMKMSGKQGIVLIYCNCACDCIESKLY